MALYKKMALFILLSCFVLLLPSVVPAITVKANTYKDSDRFVITSVKGGYHNIRVTFKLDGEEYYKSIQGVVLYQIADEVNYSYGTFNSYQIVESSDFTINMSDINVGEKKYTRLVYLPQVTTEEAIYNVMEDNNTEGWDAYFSDFIVLERKGLDQYTFTSWAKTKMDRNTFSVSAYCNTQSDGYIGEFFIDLYLSDDPTSDNWQQQSLLNTSIVDNPAAADTSYTVEFYGLAFGYNGEWELKENTTYYYRFTAISEPDKIIAEGSFKTPLIHKDQVPTPTVQPEVTPTVIPEEPSEEEFEEVMEEVSEETQEASPEESQQSITTMDISLSKTSYSYDGTAKQPAVTVKDGATELTIGTDYSVEYTDNIKAGEALVTITGIGNYNGVVELTFTIIQSKIKLSITAGVKKAKIMWCSFDKADGYEIYMATSKTSEFSLIKTVGATTTSYLKAKLKTGKTYYFKVRSYQIVDGEKVYSEFSTVKSCTVK